MHVEASEQRAMTRPVTQYNNVIIVHPDENWFQVDHR
jgi:hypothetical protein